MPSPTPTLDTFLGGIANLVRTQNVAEVRSYLLIEPEFPAIYSTLRQELQQNFSAGKEKLLDNKCDGFLGRAIDPPWPAFSNFMVAYFTYLRDLNISDLLATFNGLSTLLQSCKVAFGNPTHGIVLLDTILVYSKVLARVAIGLDRQPELIAHITEDRSDPEGEGTTLPEKAANLIRDAFVTCVQDRTPPGQPGKWTLTFKLANLVLKILFQSYKLSNAVQLFTHIRNFVTVHPLSQFPRADRVTFNYYAGRSSFALRQYFRASQLLQDAWDECHTSAHSQRRLILLHLTTANLLQGRFPTQNLFNHAAAKDLAPHFTQLSRAIKLGDIVLFRRLTTPNPKDPPSSTANFLLRHKLLLQVQSGAEMLLYRSLLRRVFLLTGTQGRLDRATNNFHAPQLDLRIAATAARALELRAKDPMRRADKGPGNRHTNWVLLDNADEGANDHIDPDFVGLPGADLAALAVQGDPLLPTLDSVECMTAALIAEGLLNGFVAHNLRKFAVQGARGAGDTVPTHVAARSGWPNVWAVFAKQNALPASAGRGAGGGRVVRLSGVKGVGAG